MAHKITDLCNCCATCVPECPTEAIHEGSPHFTIDPDTCIDCGACVPVCPCDAIVEE